MIARIVWLLALTTIALCTTGLQIDRQSRVSSAIADIVPEPFRAFSQAHVTAAKLENGKPQAALKEARRLIERRPIPAENLRLLAAAQFNAGFVTESAVTMQYAARRGWRDPISQQAMMRIAIAAGDQKEAARRFLALMILSKASDELLLGASEPIFGQSSSEGQDTMVGLLVGTTRWQAAFVQRGLQVLPADAYVEALVSAHAKGTVFDCGLLTFSLRSIARREKEGESAAALKNLIERQCR